MYEKESNRDEQDKQDKEKATLLSYLSCSSLFEFALN
jgi:hypothetical protein